MTTPIEIDVHLLKRRRTKIVATLGPGSHNPPTIYKLIQAGVDVFRLNFSHGDHATHQQTFEHIRKQSGRLKKHTAILADLCGPKIRVGQFPGGSIQLKPGQQVTLTTRPVTGSEQLIPSAYDLLHQDVNTGDRILLDDGNLQLEVITVEGQDIHCDVVDGGTLKDNKGINIPGAAVSAPALTEKDKLDAVFALQLGVDFIALSFVRHGDDVLALRRLIEQHHRHTPIIAKIEKPQALNNIDAILDHCDGIMVARGDLGVELPAQKVPLVQDQLADLARRRGKPVIVATQMLESMMEHPRPTRAEVSDVSHAVTSGVDGIMLSGETATGRHPVAAVAMMDAIARQAEGYLWEKGNFGSISKNEGDRWPITVSKAVARSTAQLSRDLEIRAIVVISKTGLSCKSVSSARPGSPVIGLTYEEEICRQVNLLWGVVPMKAKKQVLDIPFQYARLVVQQLGLAKPGEHILLVSGFHLKLEQNTPSVTVLTV